MSSLWSIVRAHPKPIALIVLTLVLSGTGTYFLTSPQSPFSGLHNDLKAIDPETAVAYTDIDGNTVSLESFKGKPIVINSWATWMPFSKDELVLLTALNTEFKDKVHFLAINRMEDREVVKSYLATFGIPRDIVFLIDPGDTFYRAVQGYAMPETIIYDREGVIVLHIRGVATEAEIRAVLSPLVEE